MYKWVKMKERQKIEECVTEWGEWELHFICFISHNQVDILRYFFCEDRETIISNGNW